MTGWRAASFGGLLAIQLNGCSRKLPSPTECEAVSLAMAGVRSTSQLRDPVLRGVVQELTHRCLTTPFDRQMLGCIESLGSFDVCQRDLLRRHPERARSF